MGSLSGKTVLVTGAGSGLGRALVARFVVEGARVGALDRDAERISALVDEFGDDVTGVVGDVRSLEDNRQAVRATVKAYGHLDVAIGNAGIWDFGTTLEQLPAEAAAFDEAFAEIIDINVKGYLALAYAALEPLRSSVGSLIFTLSNAAFYPGGGGPIYTASKHAGIGLVKQLAYELAPVRVNAVAPGAMSTDLRGPAALGLDESSLAAMPIEAAMTSMLPIQSVITVDDYVPFYLLLASDEGRKATGNVFQCDGGLGVIKPAPPEM